MAISQNYSQIFDRGRIRSRIATEERHIAVMFTQRQAKGRHLGYKGVINSLVACLVLSGVAKGVRHGGYADDRPIVDFRGDYGE